MELYADQLSQWGPILVMTSDSIASDEADEDYENPATLSIIWTRAGEENFWSAWAGDFGELLTIHSTNERIGKYTPTLQSFN